METGGRPDHAAKIWQIALNISKLKQTIFESGPKTFKILVHKNIRVTTITVLLPCILSMPRFWARRVEAESAEK